MSLLYDYGWEGRETEVQQEGVIDTVILLHAEEELEWLTEWPLAAAHVPGQPTEGA